MGQRRVGVEMVTPRHSYGDATCMIFSNTLKSAGFLIVSDGSG